MRLVTVRERQTFFDIAIQELGGVDAAFDLARLNNMAVTQTLASGKQLLLPEEGSDEQVAAEFKRRKWTPGTGDVYGVKPKGLNYMAIGIDFIVS